VRKGNVIAFGTRKPLNDRERVVVVFETPLGEGPSRDALKAEVQKAVRQGTGLSIDDVVGVELGVLPKTSSGKLKRAETRELYERGQLFIRSSARQGGSVDTVTEMARSQLGYLRDAIRGDRPKE